MPVPHTGTGLLGVHIHGDQRGAEAGIAGHVEGRRNAGNLRHRSSQPVPIPEVAEKAEVEIVVERWSDSGGQARDIVARLQRETGLRRRLTQLIASHQPADISLVGGWVVVSEIAVTGEAAPFGGAGTVRV